MSATSKIEWTDATWNVVTGCTKVSPGCDNCYAETFAERWRGTPGHHFENGFDITLRPERLTLPLRWRKPRRVFVNSMSDLFHKDIPDAYIARVFAAMALAPQHTFQVLTKRHARMRSLLADPTFEKQVDYELLHFPPFADSKMTRRSWPLPKAGWPLPNVWLGVSAENQTWAEARIPALLQTPAVVRFVSAEPLLGPIDLQHLKARNGALIDALLGNVSTPEGENYAACPSVLDWVIAGGESGHGARPMSPDWARSLRDQCQGAPAAFLFKQWGEYQPTGWKVIGRVEKGHAHVGDPIDDLGHRWEMRRVGKGKAGRELDGRTWDEFPAVAS
ncbi:DUF5131 family protein [Streptomyces sp. NPDC093060]|uniref:DUF5131 family protein n=1 Tax=Streptomyces sp. NPDC093060 TaxID=3366019 RepID=UPI0037FD25CA